MPKAKHRRDKKWCILCGSGRNKTSKYSGQRTRYDQANDEPIIFEPRSQRQGTRRRAYAPMRMRVRRIAWPAKLYTV